MSLSELLPTVSQLSHQDKLRLIHFLLLAVAKEEGCSLEPAGNGDSANALLNQLASTMKMYDELGTLYKDKDFVDLFPVRCGQSAISPARKRVNHNNAVCGRFNR